MKILVLKQLIGCHLYDSVKPCNEIDLLLLRDFLNSTHSEIGISFYREWLEGDDEFLHSDNMGVFRELGNICIYSEYDDKEYPDECQLPIKIFSKMLDDWSEISKKNPPYILIIRDGENLLIKGYDYEPSPLDLEQYTAQGNFNN